MKIKLNEISIRDIAKGYVNDEEEGVVGFNGKLNIRPKYQREFINPFEKTLHFNARDESVFYFSPKLCYTKYTVVRTDSVEVEETIHWCTTPLTI